MKNRRLLFASAFASAGLSAMFAACTDSYRGAVETTGTGGTTSTTTTTVGTGGDGGLFMDGGGGSCDPACSNDLKSVLDCHGQTLTPCTPDQGCSNAACIDDPCKAAEQSHSSYGCDYYALKTAQRLQADGACFAVFVANTWGKAAHIKVDRGGLDLPTETFAYIPEVQGQTVTYTPYDAAAGLGVGQVAILFLSRGLDGSVVDCPKPAAINQETGVLDTGIGMSFHITSDVPVVSYQIVPYGGGQAGVTSATLLLPTSSWDKNYVAVNAYSATPTLNKGYPSLDIVAYKDNTEVTILPKVDILGGVNVEAAVAGMPKKYTLNKGQFLQITQEKELSGSPIEASEPIGVFGAATCVYIPSDQGSCDSAQQQLAPVKALGSEYAAVRYKGRNGGQDEAPPWRMVGAVDGTTLEWIPAKPPGAPAKLDLGQVAEFASTGPFVVKSQNAEHPFYLGATMTGGQAYGGEGDPDWVNVIPPSQFLTNYVLFTDPTYPETSLVVIRTRSKVDGKFADVTLDCVGTLSDWQPFGDYEYTRVTLVTGDFQSVGTCSNGRQEMKSDLPFGVTVWGWGTTQQTKAVSYAYPAGAGFQPINQVVVPAIPK